MAIKILALDGLTDTKLCTLVEQLLLTIPNVENAHIDFLSQRLTLTIDANDTAETIQTVVRILKKNIPDVTVRLTETVKANQDSFSEQPRGRSGGRREGASDDSGDDDGYEAEDEEEDPFDRPTLRGRIFSSEQQTIFYCSLLAVLCLVPHLLSAGHPTFRFFLTCCAAFLAMEANIINDVSPENPAPLHYPVIFLLCILFFLSEPAQVIFALLLYCFSVRLSRRMRRQTEAEAGRCVDLTGSWQVKQENGRTKAARFEEIGSGDLLALSPGETVPSDGVVAEGEAVIRPFSEKSQRRPAAEGAVLRCGDLLLEGSLTLRVAGDQPASAAIFIRDHVLMQPLQSAPSVIGAKTSDFTVVILALAASFFLPYLLFGGSWRSEWLAMTCRMLLISLFPCSLAAAAALSLRGALATAVGKGYLPGSPRVLALLSQVRVVLLGFTGVLTDARFTVEEVQLAEEFEQQEFLAIVAAIEAKSDHPMAKAIHGECVRLLGYEPGPESVTGFEKVPGYGVRAMHEFRTVLIGSEQLMQELGVEVPPNFDGRHRAYVCIRNEFAGAFLLNDPLREDAALLADALHRRNQASVCVLSHCDPAVTRDAVARMGADHSLSAASLPERRKKLAQVVRTGKETALLAALPEDIAALGGQCICVELGEPPLNRFPAPYEILCEENTPTALANLMKLGAWIRRVSTAQALLLFAGRGLLIYCTAYRGLSLVGGALGCVCLSLVIPWLSTLLCPVTPQEGREEEPEHQAA